MRVVVAAVFFGLAASALPTVAQVARARVETPGGDAEVRPSQTPEQSGVARADGSTSLRTFFLSGTSPFNDANEVSQALRNLLEPRSKVLLVMSQNAIVVEATPEQIALAQKILNDLDRPRKPYRLLFTVSELESGKRIGVQHFAMVMVAGQRGTLKQGSKVPVVTGSYDPGRPSQNTQVTYLDVGMNFDATLEENGDGVQLKSKVEQSSIAEEKSGVGPQDPVVRQTVLEGISHLAVGRPMVIGSLDVPGSTRHFEVEALVERER